MTTTTKKTAAPKVAKKPATKAPAKPRVRAKAATPPAVAVTVRRKASPLQAQLLWGRVGAVAVLGSRA